MTMAVTSGNSKPRPARWVCALATLGALCCAAAAWAQGEPPPTGQPDPQSELKSFTVADGFEVHLFAAEPLAARRWP